MEASQYGDDPDSAYGDEVYVQLSTSDVLVEKNNVDEVTSIVEGVIPPHWHPT